MNQVKMENFIKDLSIFLILWIICGLFAIIYIQLPYYDWYNYHYYNSWAYINDRYDLDFLAANYRTYFIPYIDLLQYFILSKFNNCPESFVFFESWDSALVLTFVYKIGNLILNNKLKEKYCLILYNIIFVSFTPLFFLLTNFSMNDMAISVFQLWGVYVILKNLFNNEEIHRLRNIYLGGFIIGISFSLKLTSIIYVFTIFAVMLILFNKIEKPFRTIGLYLLGVSTSFILISGHWYWNMYKHFQNPFIPYFNDIFKSQYSQVVNFVNTDFDHVKARNFIEFIFFPFQVSSYKHTFGNSELSFDPRYAIAISLSFIMIPFLIYFEKFKKDKIFYNVIPVNYLWFLVYFTLISFYTNCAIFATYRYTSATFVLFGYIVIASIYAINDKVKNKSFFIAAYLIATILYVTFTKDYGHVIPANNKFKPVPQIIYVKDVNIEDNSYVFTFDVLTSFTFPFQNPTAHYRIITYPKDSDLFFIEDKEQNIMFDILANSIYTDKLYKTTKEIMDSDNKVYFISTSNYPETVKIYKKGLDHYSNGKRKIENCRFIDFQVNSKYDRLEICEYNKIKRKNK